MMVLMMVLELGKGAWHEDREELGVVEAWWVVVVVVVRAKSFNKGVQQIVSG